MRKNKEGYYLLEKFANQPGLIHGFSTRKFGNLKVGDSLSLNRNLDKFLQALGIEKDNLVMMEQVHGNQIRKVGKKNKGKVIKGVDGLITNQRDLFLGVNMADCLPLLFYDPEKKIGGLAHVGWKGILARIGQRVVEEMKTLGSNPKDIVVGIGPHIGSCCYLVGDDLVKKFKKKFRGLINMFVPRKGRIYLNLATPVLVQLIESGIKNDNIEVGTACTHCQKKEFFSYRREGNKKTYGEMLGVIGWI